MRTSMDSEMAIACDEEARARELPRRFTVRAKSGRLFPFKRFYTSLGHVKTMMHRLSTEYNVYERLEVGLVASVRNIDMRKMPLSIGAKNDGRAYFDGVPYVSLTTLSDDWSSWEGISDYFNEPARMKCSLIGQNSPEKYFIEHDPEIRKQWKRVLVSNGTLAPDGAVSTFEMREALYRLHRAGLFKECTTHKAHHMLAMMQLFGASRVLDFSSGWGDRLAAAIAGNAKFYCGVDPSKAVHSGYREMIDTLVPPRNRHRFVTVRGRFEEVGKMLPIPRGGYDLCYTSPPYFDLENYGVDVVTTRRWLGARPKWRVWFDEFLVPSLETAWRAIRPGGTMAININQKSRTHETFVYEMVRHMDVTHVQTGELFFGGLLCILKSQTMHSPFGCGVSKNNGI